MSVPELHHPRTARPTKPRRASALAALLAMIAVAACEIGPESGRGFRLPEGDVAEGRERFVDYRCVDCHSIVGMDELRTDVVALMDLPLGGGTTQIATYGELVTSIINPSHR
ncbi:MAG: hypothetical protein MI723_12400, partial [Caulobacterales bacterium]|nr:hypothetical protein [Caulobacterales bacterium]